MALLTSEERKEIVEKTGNYVTEKCDLCKKPMFSILRFIPKSGGVWCENCYALSKGGKNRTLAQIQQEDEMANPKKQARGSDGKKEEKVSKKIGGFLPNGSSIGDLYLLLEDEKKHSFKEGEAVAKKHKKDLMGRLGNLYRSGIRNKAWSLIVDKEAQTIQMKLGKPTGDPMVTKKEKPAAAKKASAKAEKEEKKAQPASVTSKGAALVAKLVRRTLKSGKDWTKNKLVEYLKKEHDFGQKESEAAIASEIKAGGIKLENGVLELV